VGKVEVKKRCGYLAFATLLVGLLFHLFQVGNAEIGNVKNWKGHVFSRLTWSEGNDTPPFWHSCMFITFRRISPTHPNPVRRI
jgi:hypothetical protein